MAAAWFEVNLPPRILVLRGASFWRRRAAAVRGGRFQATSTESG